MTSTSAITPPQEIKIAAAIAAVQSLIGIGYAFLLFYRGFTGASQPDIIYESSDAVTSVAFGTALFFLIIFGTVIVGAYRMAKGLRWGRGPVIMLENLLLLMSYYMFTGSQILMGVVTALSTIMALGLLFSPRSVQWAAERFAH
ncbi:hypothetical protein N7326_02625 [Corynebacterium sp. ES2794-CONJ1]|uniref:hypothetical protein n=1 Tax=unclassified Corynebacterium TaxID=2624378 RepID=UPI0021678481|nr:MULTISPECIES: hypothetical protein [unclassified Corynebacterium]MCS4489469.1 hypothetical protein [Corynebacterium sp. ES2775-CONJ]MCS4491520.1 hypothetical protein [Corynebacterium sp. ES2715-CONJ3]MCS4531380.1 hypothetical protein [Corynebacterium sp. ES2730-CONJ]MCU9518767.1 hypothetical protein [Corynebacterium sp. ES2794-CONJ1]